MCKIYGIRNLNGKWLTPSGWGYKKDAIKFNSATIFYELDRQRDIGENVTYESLYTNSELRSMVERETLLKSAVKQEIERIKKIIKGIK